MDLKTLQTAKAAAKHIGQHIVADGGVALRIKCVAYPESSAHYADAVLVSATSLTLSIDGSADTTVGSSGVLAFATYTTLGALVDAINLSSNWKAEIVAGLRSDAVDGSELLARSTSTFRMHESKNLNWDSSDNGVAGLDFLLEPGEAFDDDEQVRRHRVGLKRILAKVNTSDASATNIIVYELKKDKASAYKTLATFSAADDTEKDTGESEEPIVQADWGNSILVRFRNSTGWADSGAYLSVQGLRE